MTTRVLSPNAGRFRQARRMLRQPQHLAAVVFLGLLALGAMAAPLSGLPNPNEQRLEDRLEQPLSVGAQTGETHWLGTDQLGRDILSRVLSGARASAAIALPAVLLAVVLGAGLGVTAGFRGGLLDTITMRAADIQLAFPFLILALLLIAVLGRSIGTLIVAFAVSDWAIFARTSRGEAMAVRVLPYVEAARAIGVSGTRILVRHIIPNASTSAIVLATLDVSKVMVAEASLSFLGLGVPPSTPSWGSVIADGRGYLGTAWWISAFPGVVLLLVVLATTSLGDLLRDALDPKMKERVR